MSKTKGNVVDPLETLDSYGTDALRLSLVTGTTPGQDVPLSMEKARPPPCNPATLQPHAPRQPLAAPGHPAGCPRARRSRPTATSPTSCGTRAASS